MHSTVVVLPSVWTEDPADLPLADRERNLCHRYRRPVRLVEAGNLDDGSALHGRAGRRLGTRGYPPLNGIGRDHGAGFTSPSRYEDRCWSGSRMASYRSANAIERARCARDVTKHPRHRFELHARRHRTRTIRAACADTTSAGRKSEVRHLNLFLCGSGVNVGLPTACSICAVRSI